MAYRIDKHANGKVGFYGIHEIMGNLAPIYYIGNINLAWPLVHARLVYCDEFKIG